MRRDYYLHKRNGIFYVEFLNTENGEKMSARSTGETDPDRAKIKAEVWKASGIPAGREGTPRPFEEAAAVDGIIKSIRRAALNPDDALRIVSALRGLDLIDIAAVGNTGQGAVPFVDFLQAFWDYDKSEYIQDKLAHGYRFTRHYAHECQKRLKSEIKPFFGDKKVNCVTTEDLSRLTKLMAAKGLATSTVNQTLLVCCTPLKWAFNKKIIASSPVAGLTKFSITNKERGILTDEEAAAVFAVDWADKRALVASLVSATTGARLGECLALRRSDIGENTLIIAHSYSLLDGLKLPKNNRKRAAPLLPEVKAALLDLLGDNPHVDKKKPDPNYDPFVFYSVDPKKPCGPKFILNGLKEAIESVNGQYKAAAEKAGLEKPKIRIDRGARNIVFHSWRHWFCSKITEIMDGEKVAKVSGHLTEAVFKKYADHIEAKTVQEVGEAAAQVFGNILQFRKAPAA